MFATKQEKNVTAVTMAVTIGPGIPYKVFPFQTSPPLIAEFLSGPKGRRAEPHNHRIRKTMHLIFHGHGG